MFARPYYHPPLHARTTSYVTRGAPLPLTDSLAARFMLLPCGYMTSIPDIHIIVALLHFINEHMDPILDRLR